MDPVKWVDSISDCVFFIKLATSSEPPKAGKTSISKEKQKEGKELRGTN